MPCFWSIHAALILANSLIGIGSIVGALGLPATNPFTFTLIRQIVAGLFLWSMSIVLDKNSNGLISWIQPRHRKHFILLGILVLLNQTAFLMGIQLAGPLVASIWQPSSPILTAFLGMCGAFEDWNIKRLMAVFLAFGGCAAMILDSSSSENDAGNASPFAISPSFLIGNFLFFVDCLAAALYILMSKKLLRTYSPLAVTAWSYVFAAPSMFILTLASSYSKKLQDFVCPACNATFLIPSATIPALLYYIFGISIGGWLLIVWSNQHATGTLVLGYSVLQPVTSLCITVLLLVIHWVAPCRGTLLQNNEHVCLTQPDRGALYGFLGVAGGLYFIVKTEPPAKRNDEAPTSIDYGTIPLIDVGGS